MNDILKEWKENHFILAPKTLLDKDEILIVLTDLGYWLYHADALERWCAERDATMSGMTVVLGSEELLTEFYLRWS